MSSETKFERTNSSALLFGHETDGLPIVGFDQYREIIDKQDSLQYLGLTSEEEFDAAVASPSTMFAPVSNNGNALMPVAVTVETITEANTRVIEQEAYIEVVPGFFATQKPADEWAGDKPRIYRVGVEVFEEDQASVIFEKPSARKEAGDRDFDIFGQSEPGAVVEAYHVIVSYDREKSGQQQVIDILESFPGQVIDLDENSDIEIIDQAFGLISDVVDEQSADFPITGEIPKEEFLEMLSSDKFFTKVYLEQGEVKSLVIVGNSLQSIDWFRADKAEETVLRLRKGEPTYAYEPLLVVSGGPPESGYSVPVFLSGLLKLDKIGANIGSPNSWTMFYECSPRSIFFTPRILSQASELNGYQVSGAVVQRTSFIPVQ